MNTNTNTHTHPINAAQTRVQLIENRIKMALNPSFLKLEDQSKAHAGHAGARESGGGHYHLTLISEAFEGQSLLVRHRLVYNALEGLIGPEIHALQIVAKTPEEQTRG